MWVRRLRLHEFRNHGESLVELVDGPVIIAGPNGSGKTSILEAVAVLASSRSFRTSDASAWLRAGAERGIVEADVVIADREVRLGVAFGDVDRKYFRNGTPQRSHRDIALLRAVVFSPDDLRLAKGSPGERRDFLDDVLTAAQPAGAGVLAEWARVIKQRNVLLKSLYGSRRGPIPSALDTWTDMVADKGAELVVARARLLARMRPHILSAVSGLCGLDADVSYRTAWFPGDVDEDTEVPTVRESLNRVLHDRAREELDRGVTLAGPHRDDVGITVSGRDVRSQASQGEQRVAALALRLGELAVLGEIHDDPPVLLLDDVFSELDPVRRSRLLERLPRTQTLITTTAAADADGPPAEVVSALAGAGLLEDAEPLFIRVVDAKVGDQ